MKGILFAILGGAFITLQGVANSTISSDLGTWQAATLTQGTGFVAALLILLMVREGNVKGYAKVKPWYLFGGALAAIIIFGNVTAIHRVGVTMSVAVVLIAQLCQTFVIDGKGWFGVAKQRMGVAQFLGIGLMILGVVILKM